MPRQPVYLAQVGVPIPGAPQIDATPLAAPYTALGRGSQEVESYVRQALRHEAAMNAEITRQKQTTEALGIYYDSIKELNSEESSLRTGKIDPETNTVIEPPATSADYLPRFRGAVERIGKDGLTRTNDPMVQEAFKRMWTRHAAGQDIQAEHYGRQLFVGETRLDALNRYHDSLRFINSTQIPEEAQREADIFRTYIRGSEGTMGRDWSATLLERYDKEVNVHEAKKDIRAGMASAELEEKYAGKLDSGVLDALIVRADTNMAHARIAYKASIANWAESVERVTYNMIASSKLTQEWLDEFRDAFTGEKLNAFNKALREQQLGTSDFAGNPQITNYFRSAVGNRSSLSQNPEVLLNDLTRAYNRSEVNGKDYTSWSSLLSTEIEKRRNESKATNNQEQTEERRILAHRHQAVIDDINQLFRPTEKFVNFDAVLTLNANMMKEEINRRSSYGGGTEDPREVYNEILPKYLAPTGERATQQIDQIRRQLDFPDYKTLEANRANIGETKYYDQLRKMREINGIEKEIQRLERNEKMFRNRPTPKAQ